MILRDANKLILLIWNFTATFCAVQDPYAEGRNMEPDTRTSTSAVRYHYFPPRVNRNSNQLLGPQPNMGRSVGYYWDGHQYRYFQNSLASDFGQDNDFNWGTAPLLKNNAGTGELDKTENSTITEDSKADNTTSDDGKESETTAGKTTTSSPKSKTGKIENTSASSKASSHFTTTKSTKNATDSSTTTTEPSTTTSTEASTTTTDYPTTTTESTITTSATTTTTPTTATTTTTTTTPTTTVTTTPATVQSTATTTTATVIPVVPPRDANAGRCTPKNAPGIGKNGQCSSTADLSRNCATLQITTSSDCGDYPGKWCCYSGKTKQAGTGGFKCSPDSLPSVGMNGRCTSTKNLDSHCFDLDIAASVKDCGDFDGKWCCYCTSFVSAAEVNVVMMSPVFFGF
ncbi:SOD_CuZN16 [Ramazzottius varieornatus]|uniref:SOD_CuZN16 n=1 Tax=Ramazzottius varieornatus TaxID=947166 RepID=A0A1D1VMT9_RAMVA|nr:SOD_CuZN16 [Ramazzottius varieornatus]